MGSDCFIIIDCTVRYAQKALCQVKNNAKHGMLAHPPLLAISHASYRQMTVPIGLFSPKEC